MADTLYQLAAAGPRHPDIGLSGSVTAHSRRVFGSPEAAEAHIPEFKAACCAPRSPCDMHYMDPADITVKTVTLELAGATTPAEPWEPLPDALRGIRDAILRSRAMLDLRDDWDEGGAKRIAEGAWRRAAEFLARQATWAWDGYRRAMDAPDITPSADGGVDIHWDRPGYEMLIGVPADPEAEAGFYGDDRRGASVKGALDTARASGWLADWLAEAGSA
jgi:hypothetical protein